MTSENRKTWRRKDWDTQLDMYQKKLDESIYTLQPKIEQYSEQLTEQLQSGSPELVQASQNVIQELDNEWQHHDDSLMIAGNMYMPRSIAQLFDTSSSEYQYVDGMVTGESKGFNSTIDDDRVRIGLYLDIGKASIRSSSYALFGHMFAIAPLERTSVTILRPTTEQMVASADQERTLSLIRSATENYAKHILNPESSFYWNNKGAAQLQTIEDIASIPNRELPSEVSNDAFHLSGEFPHLYFFDVTSNKVIKIPSQGTEPLSVKGKVRGFTALDCLPTHPPRMLHSPQDLVDPEAGIVAGIDVIESNIGLETDKHLYYAPLRLGNKLEMTTSRP